MSRELTNPLQNVIKRAAQTLPVHTGKVATQQARFDRRQGQAVILADISESMNSPAWGGQRKIDILRTAIDIVLNAYSAKLFVFSSDIRESESIPAVAQGGTALHHALKQVRVLDPGVTLVISDGHPDDPAAALEAAKAFRGAIDVLYIGPETDHKAIEFMRRLASLAGGDVQAYDVGKLGNPPKLIANITGFLTAPKK